MHPANHKVAVSFANFILPIVGVLLLALSGCAGSRPQIDKERAAVLAMGFDPADLGSARAQDNFFDYVNQSWILAHEIPSDRTSYGVFALVFDRTELQVRKIIERAASLSEQDNATKEASASQRQIGALFRSFMDATKAEELGLQPLARLLSEVDALTDQTELIAFFARLQHFNVNLPFVFFIETDADDPERNLLYFWQAGLALPDRDYYLRDDAKFIDIRAAYGAHITRMFELADWDNGDAAAATILEIETTLAQRHWSRVANRDRARIYSNKVTPSELASANFWRTVLNSGEFGDLTTIVLAQDDYFERLPQLLAATPIAAWQTYLRFRILETFAPYLNADIVSENFAFRSKTLRGQQQQRPRWKRGVALVNRLVGEQVGQLYVAEHFPPSAKVKIAEMVKDLRGAFALSIDALDWMSAATKAEARTKLAAFNSKLGYPEQWRDYSGMSIRADDLLGNVMRARAFENAHEIAKLAKPVDRGEWGMTPQTINAYYRPTYNEIVFPAAILQPPFFDPNIDAAFNYGAIGAIIGHEFSHGFDDQGRKFDGQGRLRDWWTESDNKQYSKRAARLVAQYNKFQALPDVAVNGELTLGENIGDLAGLTMALRAYRMRAGTDGASDGKEEISGFTAEQRFFIGYAHAWRSMYREEVLRERLLSDPHSPAEYRVIGVLRNMDAFYTAFDVQPGDGMYLPKSERVQIW